MSETYQAPLLFPDLLCSIAYILNGAQKILSRFENEVAEHHQTYMEHSSHAQPRDLSNTRSDTQN